ncbi:MAG TPA: signal peptidase I [Acidimicrobiales bacterium]|nr:signal peptidase I [Acidimicrobiales bacterium]
MSDLTPHEASGVMTSEAPTTPEPPAKKKNHRRRIFIEWVAILVVAVLVSFLLRTFAFQTFFIPSGSMEPTLQVGDRIIVNKLAVSLGTINVGDIVVFRAPPAENCDPGNPVTDLVKRVVGIPGDSLKSSGNTILIKEPSQTQFHALVESWTHAEPLGEAITPITLKKNQYFMVGDNHSDSCDSRTWGTVPRSDIIGKAFVRIWPLSRIGFL